MPQLDQKTIDIITDQAITEIEFDRQYKQGKIPNWQEIEDYYYGVKKKSSESRANIDLAQMQEFVHTLLSKIDDPLVFKFVKRKEAQLQRVNRLNALRTIDHQKDEWDIKDIVGKKQGIMYGRAIYFYYADSHKGYKAHLENTDVYDFLIDPAAGGIDVELANHLGRYGVVFTRKELKADTKKKAENRSFIKSAVDELLSGTGNNTDETQEEVNKRPRTYGQNTLADKELDSPDKFKFWQWFTTYKGKRYCLIMTEKGASCIKINELTDLFTPTKDCPLSAWPVWTWAAFPDMTEFWTPSYCDYAIELFMAENTSINQMMDNHEAINKPQKVVDVSAIKDMSKLKYRKDGVIPVKEGVDARQAVQFLQIPSIRTPIDVFNLLVSIQEKASGVTAGAKGVADEEGKVGIYEGNQMAEADRFGLLNKSYSYGYRRFSGLYQTGVKDHLIKKVAVEIIGIDGIETEDVTRADMFKEGDDFNVLVEASNAENLTSLQNQQVKMEFLNSEVNNPIINPKKLFELKATIVGVTPDEIKELTDISEFGDSKLLAECARDIESLTDEMIKPNANANNAYMQKMVDYMKDQEENMTDEQKQRFIDYIILLQEIIVENEIRALAAFETNTSNQGGALAGEPPSNINKPAIKETGV